jgi:hypothetical protein
VFIAHKLDRRRTVAWPRASLCSLRTSGLAAARLGNPLDMELDLVVARVTAANVHPGARGHSSLLGLDLGGRGERETPAPIALADAEALVGTQVVCALEGEDAVVLAVHTHDAGLVLLRPESEVADGSAVA